ncbi:FHA domain-containing protein, partial [Kitasatospora sp. MBT63]|uniref:FHA domain-containing protein n=1 Tax=Kitasatospora sp. MBT63 TaxID=1444768 RepID=UPI00053B7B5A
SQQAQHSQHSQQQAPQPPQHPAEPGSRPGYGYPPPAYGQQPYEQPFQQPVQQPYEQPYERGGYERGGPERGGYEPGRPAEPGGYEPGGFEQGGFEQGGYEPQPFEPQSFEPQSFEKAPPPPPAPSRPSAPAQPSQPFPDQDGYERSGPVYAQPGDDLGTSFRLAPPGDGAPGRTPGQAPPAAPVRTNWIAVVSADREYFTDMMIRSGPEAAGLFFPPYCPDRRIPLTGRGQLRIGRRSQHRGTVPEIDLSVAPEDPGASHNHAMLAEQADGSWVLVDQDSTNGTTVNGSPDPVPPHTAIPLNDGDRIHIGAWTTITVHRSA